MKKSKTGTLIVLFIALGFLTYRLNAQINPHENVKLSPGEKSIIAIASVTAKGDLPKLKTELNTGLDAGLTINQIKEVIVHLYAYCGFPRSIRGLQTFLEVLGERKTRGIVDKTGADASPVPNEQSKYERGKKILGELTKVSQDGPPAGYAAFAPVIDTFLKEHLFADIFERDVLTYAERELVTISVLSAIGGAEPMLRSHLTISLNAGLTPSQLNEFAGIIKSTLGEKEAKDAQGVLNEVLKNQQARPDAEQRPETVFPKGEIITGSNFTGTAWLQMLVINDSTYNASIGNVTFAPKARTNWHKHPGGQILLITHGHGYYQEKGKPAKLLQKGDVVRIPPGAEHWHGATANSTLTHIAISPNQLKGNVVWLLPVSDEEYNKIK
jgi:quercetin dioxygenase-like cupin family protein/alkylhydroperoxidase/carboxymuconolactone decarboxylase family protein YurZ